MKVKSISLALILFSFFSICGFSVEKSLQSDNKSKIVVTGYVISKGSMPFTQLAVISDDGLEYSIISPEKQKRRLLNLQGRHLRFTLVKNDQMNWIVKKYKVIK